MFTAHEVAIVMWRLQGSSYVAFQAQFNRRFHYDGPIDKTIHTLVNKFKRTGSLAMEPGQGCPPTSNERIEAIRTSIERSPKSVRHLSVELDIPHSTVHKVLRFTLKMKQYQLHEEDLAQRVVMCVDFLVANEERNILNHILFSDEATYHICGKINRHN